MKPSKTRLAHTIYNNLSENNIAGFDFLGFHIQQFLTKCGSALGNKTQTGFKTLIVPSTKSCVRHQAAIKKMLASSSTQIALISKLNPIILGSSRYFSVSDGLRTFSKQDYLIYLKLRRWSKRIKGSSSLAISFWNPVGSCKWIFKPIDNPIKLAFHTSVPCSVNSYVKVKNISSPYDGMRLYWAKRLKTNPVLSPSTGKLLAKQKGKSAFCGCYFWDYDVFEIDHIIPKSKKGKDI